MKKWRCHGSALVGLGFWCFLCFSFFLYLTFTPPLLVLTLLFTADLTHLIAHTSLSLPQLSPRPLLVPLFISLFSWSLSALLLPPEFVVLLVRSHVVTWLSCLCSLHFCSCRAPSTILLHGCVVGSPDLVCLVSRCLLFSWCGFLSQFLCVTRLFCPPACLLVLSCLVCYCCAFFTVVCM